MRLFVAGDTHGNDAFLNDYLYPIAAELGAHAIIQLGDFGFWEHEETGVRFLDAVAVSAERYQLPLYWLHGNHDKHSLALARYGAIRDHEGFISCRKHVLYIPQGHVWTWAGTRMRAFGGAYSIDKQWRLDLEARRARQAAQAEDERRRAGHRAVPVRRFAETIWFPEEEPTDAQFAALLDADHGPVDIVFSHDKPRAARPGMTLKDLPECLPNQDRLQRALETHQPSVWLHGHLHQRYSDTVGRGAHATRVTGLACDDAAAPRFWRPTDAWAVLDIDDGAVSLTAGADADDWLHPEDDEPQPYHQEPTDVDRSV